MILGVGTDLVDLARFEAAIDRSPRLVDRLFTPREAALPVHSLAARCAAKEALAKALGAPAGLHWTDATVVKNATGQPELAVSGTVAARAAELAVARLHLSMSHDAGIASAVVVAETA